MPAATRPNLFYRLRAALYFGRGRFHRHFGNLSGDRREYQMAVNDFSKAIDLHPSYVPALYSRGVLYWRELENYYRAVKDLTRVIELAPHWYEAWFNRALAHQLRNEIPEAIADYEHYLTLPGKPKWRVSAQTQLEMIKEVEGEKAARKQ
ncbi:MAG TPA: tetratricopeptide repeat protein [Anaerolineae bacterium]|nr:tetratricopeptide repeat protein [Anaerolineae bacterium]